MTENPYQTTFLHPKCGGEYSLCSTIGQGLGFKLITTYFYTCSKCRDRLYPMDHRNLVRIGVADKKRKKRRMPKSVIDSLQDARES